MKRNKSCVKPSSKHFIALYYWGKILGLNPPFISRKNQLEYSYTGFLYGSILAVVYCYIYYTVLKERRKVILPGETPLSVIVDTLGITWQFFETSSTWLVFAVHQNRLNIIARSFATAEKTSKRLGIPDECDKRFKEFALYLTIHNAIYCVTILGSNFMWSYWNNFKLMSWMSFNVPPIASFNAEIIFVWCLILVRRKFRRLNEMLVSCRKQFFTSDTDDKASEMDGRRCDADFLLDKVNAISQLHRELRDIIYHIEGHFRLVVLFRIGNSFISLTLYAYGMYRYTKEHPREASDFIFLGAISHWILYSTAWLFVISSVCGSTSDEANNAGNMLHKLLNSCNDFRNVREAVKFNSLSFDLLQNHVNISVFGIFKLDHFLVYRIIAAVTSYLVIMLQLDE